MKRFFSKKLSLICLFSFLTLGAFADLQFSVLPYFSVPLGIRLQPSFGVSASIDYSPITVRERDNVYFKFQGSYGLLNAAGLSPLSLWDMNLGAGYEFMFLDRFSLNAELTGGLWTIPKNDANKLPSATGYSIGGKLGANFYVLPYLSAGIFAGYKYYGSDKTFMHEIQAGVGVHLNLSKSLFAKPAVKLVSQELDPIFPVFYSFYDDNKFGTVTFVNNEKNTINDVAVSIYIEEFMTNENVVETFDVIASGEEFSVDLKAFFNENILNTITPHRTNAIVTVSYKNLGVKTEYKETLQFDTLGRNNMSWEDDRRATTFISGKDASANRFARYLQLIMKNRLNEYESVNIQYARGIFAALKAFGINYVVDPSSAFTDNIGSASIDFLQFPYQTLLYHGGDCDDLTILNCSLLEALGIETAMITIPGHIYMAFDSGYSVDSASKLSDGEYIIWEDKVWIPIEITLCRDTFQQAKTLGAYQWRKAGEDAAIIPVHEAWKVYSPLSIPDSDVDFELPNESDVIKYLK